MRIGIIGSGHIGGTLARLWAKVGHEVALSNSRGPASLASLVAEIGPQAHAATVDDAAAFGDVVLVAIPFGKYNALPAARLAGKTVVDAMNYYPQRDGQLDLAGGTSSELLARYLPDSRVVKAFNTMHFQTLATEGRPAAPLDERLALFIAGDESDARATVAHLIEQIGFAPIDTGTLRQSSRQEPGAPIYNRPMKASEARERLAG